MTVSRESGDIDSGDALCGAGRRQARELVVRMLPFHGDHHAVGRTQMAGDPDEGGEIREGPGNDHRVSSGRPIRLGTGADDRHVSKSQLYGYLFDKACFFTYAVEHCYGTLRLDQGDRYARQPRPGSNIDQRSGRQMRHHREAVDDVLREHRIRIAHRGEIVDLVPLRDEFDVSEQLILRVRRNVETQDIDRLPERLRPRHADRSAVGEEVAKPRFA